MRTTAYLIFACGLLVLTSQALAAEAIIGQQPPELAAQDGAPGSRLISTDVVALDLTGAMPFEKVIIEDFDSMVTPAGDHLVPLRHLLEALEIEGVYKDGILSFSPKTTTAPLDVVVDTKSGVIRVNGQATPVTIVTGVSDLTKNDEVFVSTDAVALGLRVQLKWDEAAFAFKGTTDQKFAMWKKFDFESLMGIETTRIQTTLPELFPPAAPRKMSLDFMELELRPYVAAQGGNASSGSAAFTIDAPRESFWGSAFGGRYRFRVSQPYVTGTHNASVAPVTLDQFEWTRTMAHSELAVGDSTYGVSDLIFPILRTSGIRFSGVTGVAGVTTGGRSPGMSNSFSRAQVFEGAAPNGSHVDLILNGQPIQTQVVLAGVYRFEEVRLAPGTLNNIRVKITEPGGVERVIERSIFGRSIQLPRHAFAHLGGVGTNRDNRNWEAWGLVAAERVLYGVTDSLTIGTTWAMQQDAGPNARGVALVADRGFPASSVHRGAQVSWVPSEHMQLIGDAAFSDAQANDFTSSGSAYRVNTDLFPSRDMRLSTQWFNYSPGFFNGNNMLLRDRAGYNFDFSWNINKRLHASSSGGSMRNNLDGSAINPFRIDFQRVQLMAGITPRLATSVTASRLVNAQGSGNPMIYSVQVQASPLKNVTTDVSFSRGASPKGADDTQLSSGLSIPGYSPYQLQLMSANVRVPLNQSNAIGASYFHGPSGNRASITESFSPGTRPLRFTTEFGYDARMQASFFSERSEYRLDRAARKVIGFEMRYDLGRWTSMVNLTFSELFHNDGGIPKPMADPAFSADNGAIYGKVFVDANANGKRDVGEPGVDHVRVMSDNGIKTETDKNGNFMIAAAGQAASYRVFIDMDSLPAIFSPTNGLQTANVRAGNLTEINLGVSPLHTVTGVVEIPATEQGSRPLDGVKVLLRRVSDGKEVGDSITGENGAYYLSDIRPGQYTVQVDMKTLPSGATVDKPMTIEIQPSADPQDLRLSPFQVHVPAPAPAAAPTPVTP